jgi:hypothetical protein
MKFKLTFLMKNKFLLTSILTLLALATSLRLQAKGEDTGRSKGIEFTCATWENLPHPEIFYRQGSEYLPLVLSAGERSKVYRLKGAESLELFTRKDKTADAGTSKAALEYELVGTTPLLKGVTRMLFLIEVNKETKGLPLQILGIDDSVESFPAGSFRFINQTPDLLRIEFGGTTCELPPGALKVVIPKIPAAGGFLPAIIKNAEGRNLLENRFFAQHTGRELVIVKPPAEGRTELVMKFLSDAVAVSPPSKLKPSDRQ